MANNLRGKKVSAQPYDENQKPLSGLTLPLVDGSGNIVGWAPVGVVDNGDGTVSMKVDTELEVESMSLTIKNVKVAGTDQTGNNLRYIKTDNDGVVQVDIVSGGSVDPVGLKDTTATQIDPATEQKQDSIITELTTLNAKDFATETTLALIKAQTDNLDVLLSTRASETTLASLEAKDFATETTLAGIKTKTDLLNFIGTALEVTGSVTADFAGDLADLDSGAGTDEHEVIAIGLPGAGGHVVGGTAMNPLRVDPTGTTTQPISATSLPLPTGAATELTLSSLLTAFNAEDFATEATLALVKTAVQSIDTDIDVALSTRASETTLSGIKTKTDQLTFASTRLLVDGSGVTQPISAVSLPLPTGAATEATLATMLTLAGFQARINTLGQKTMAASTPVVLASDQSPISVTVTNESLNVASLADQGKMYSLATNPTNFTPSGTEHPFLLLRNGAGSGKTVKIRDIIEGIISTNKPTTFRVYANPTITATGTAATPRNKRIGSPASAITAFTLPTISSTGTYLIDSSVVVAGVFTVEEDLTLQFPPGNDLLITVLTTVNNTECTLTIDWAEV